MDDLGLPSGDLLHFATLKIYHRTRGSTHENNENSMVALSSSFSSPVDQVGYPHDWSERLTSSHSQVLEEPQ